MSSYRHVWDRPYPGEGQPCWWLGWWQLESVTGRPQGWRAQHVVVVVRQKASPATKGYRALGAIVQAADAAAAWQHLERFYPGASRNGRVERPVTADWWPERPKTVTVSSP